MDKITLQIDPERITLNQLIQMEEGLSNRQSRDLLANFVLDGEKYMDQEKAQELIGNLNLTQLRDVTRQFVEDCKTLGEELVPNEQSGG